MEVRKVVTCFLERDGKILILKRSGKVGTYRGKWGAVAGYIRENENPEDAARREISEEVGIHDPELVKRGEPFTFEDPEINIRWEIHPFRFRVKTGDIRIDWEHVSFAWIDPSELSKYETVPKLEESWRRVSAEK